MIFKGQEKSKSLIPTIVDRFKLLFKGPKHYEELLRISEQRYFELQAQKEKEERINKRFQKFVSKGNVETCMANDRDPEIKTKKRIKTLYFSDIRNFTQISERLEDDLGPFLSSYFKTVSQPVIQEKGEIYSYIGDSIFAAFDDSYSAVNAAIRSRFALRDFNDQRRKYTYSGKDKINNVKAGIGIGTGESYVGNIGFEKKMTETVIGRYVNLANRLEGLTKLYNVPILIDENTLNRIPAEFVFNEDIDRSAVDEIEAVFSLIKEKLNNNIVFFREIGTIVPLGLETKVKIYEIMNSSSYPIILLKSIFRKEYESILHNEFNCPNAASVAEQEASLESARNSFMALQEQFQRLYFDIRNFQRKINSKPQLTSREKKEIKEAKSSKDFIVFQKIKIIDNMLSMIKTNPERFEAHPWQGIELLDHK